MKNTPHRELLHSMYMKYYDKVVAMDIGVDSRAAASRLILDERADGEIRQEMDYLSLLVRTASLK